MGSWFAALQKTRERLSRVFQLIGRSHSSTFRDEWSAKLEEALIQADVPVRLVGELLSELQTACRHGDGDIQQTLAQMIFNYVKSDRPFAWPDEPRPFVILVAGVNGAGKTTTCAKLAHYAKKSGLRVLLGATDTFRAAGIEQLKIWADRIGCDVVAGAAGGDAAAVAFNAVDAAVARGRDVVLLDTAGRMHTRNPLMRELQKIRQAVSKRLAGAPHETWIVLDATLGHNAVLQAQAFHEMIPLTGVIVTKLDGTAKGGFVLAIRRELNIPILFAGLGESPEDLVPFDAQRFSAALVGLQTAENVS